MLVYVLAAGACCLLLVYFAVARRTLFSRDQNVQEGRSVLANAGNLAALVTVANFILAAGGQGWFHVLAAVTLLTISLSVFKSAIAAFDGGKPGIAYTTTPPPFLVSKGPYSRVRHPIYLAYILMWLAAACLVNNLAGIIVCVGMSFLYYRAASFEERLILSSAFGKDYQAYKEHTFMILPWFVPLSKR